MASALDIYFAASITGGRDDAGIYAEIIELLREHGNVLSEHIGDPQLSLLGEVDLDDAFVHDRDIEWVRRCDALVAEVTQPSTGAGYEIGRAVAFDKPVLCLFRRVEGRRLTRMLSGNRAVRVQQYADVADLRSVFAEFFGALRSHQEKG